MAPIVFHPLAAPTWSSLLGMPITRPMLAAPAWSSRLGMPTRSTQVLLLGTPLLAAPRSSPWLGTATVWSCALSPAWGTRLGMATMLFHPLAAPSWSSQLGMPKTRPKLLKLQTQLHTALRSVPKNVYAHRVSRPELKQQITRRAARRPWASRRLQNKGNALGICTAPASSKSQPD